MEASTTVRDIYHDALQVLTEREALRFVPSVDCTAERLVKELAATRAAGIADDSWLRGTLLMTQLDYALGCGALDARAHVPLANIHEMGVLADFLGIPSSLWIDRVVEYISPEERKRRAAAAAAAAAAGGRAG
jgi:hypothetical protein